jgi:hypothetical protein
MLFIDHLSQSIDTSHIGEDFASNTQQWPSKMFVFIIRKCSFIFLRCEN